MRTTERYIVVAIVVCLMTGSLRAGQTRDTLSLNRADIRLNVEDFFVADLDSDGQNEFIEFPTDRRHFMVRQFVREGLIGPALYQANFDHWLSTVVPVDIDSLPGTEIAVVFRDNKADSLWMIIIEGMNKGHVLCRTEAIYGKNISDGDSHRNPGWDGSVGKCYFVDLDGDGIKEIVMPLTVGFDLYPRGIYVYDYPSGNLRWKFLTAGNPLGISFADADEDGKKETYVKTWASFNGAQVENRLDTTAYAIAVDFTGREIWRADLHDRFDFQTGDVRVCDCDGDDTLEVYYTVLFAPAEYDEHVRVLQKHRAVDNYFLKQRSFDADHNYREICSTDLDNDGSYEIIINDRPTVLDPLDLSIIDQGPLKNIEVALVADIDGDSLNGIEVVAKKRDSLYIFDRNLKILTAYRTEYGGHVSRVKHYHSPYGKEYLGLVVTTFNEGIPNSMLYSVEVQKSERRASWLSLLYAYRLFWPTLIVAFILGIPSGIMLRRLFQSRKRPVKREDIAPYESLLMALSSFDHGQIAGRNLNRLAFLFGNLPDTEDRLNEITSNVESAIKAYRLYTVDQLNAIIRHSRHAKALQPPASELKSNTGRLDVMVAAVMEAGLRASNSQNLVAKIPETVDNIKGSIRRIAREIEKRFEVELIELLPRIFAAVGGRLKSRGINLNLISIADTLRKPVFFVESEIAAIIEELISNACAAMSNAETKVLTFKIVHRDDEVLIEISDTGQGINEGDREKLFNRDYSTKKEGGFGLYHARQQVQKFGGSISIRNNPKGPGAAVRLSLKTVKNG